MYKFIWDLSEESWFNFLSEDWPKTITKKNTKTKAKTYSTTVKNLSGAKKYYVRVRTYKTVKVGKKKVTYYSNWSTVKTVTTKKVTPAAAPTGFKLCAPKYKKLKGSWNKVSGASGYQLQYSREDGYYNAHNVQNLQAKYISCKRCGSKVNKDYIHNNSCPVCLNNMLSDTAQKRLDAFNARIDGLKASIVAEKERRAAKAPTRYLVVYCEYVG